MTNHQNHKVFMLPYYVIHEIEHSTTLSRLELFLDKLFELAMKSDDFRNQVESAEIEVFRKLQTLIRTTAEITKMEEAQVA